MMNTPEKAAPRRSRGDRTDKLRQMRQTRTATRISARPLVTRCVNSIALASSRSDGMNSPLQLGQLAPQPAPEPVARTYAPKTITPTFTIKVAQTNLASERMGRQ